MVPEELFEEMEKAVAERDELAADLERVKAEREMSDAELNIAAGHVADCWLYLDAWARSESATIEDVKEICKTLLRKQQAPGMYCVCNAVELESALIHHRESNSRGSQETVEFLLELQSEL